MLYAITYGDEKYKRAKKLNCKTAKKFGADKVKAYGPEDIDEKFKRRNSVIWNQSRGGGYWIWKPYIILKALEDLGNGDYVIYTDAGTVYVGEISKLVECMEREKQDIMVFSLTKRESAWTKRDTFLLMECDKPVFTDSMQILGSYILLKKTAFVQSFLREWLFWLQDVRAVTDQPNCLGKDNYPEFIEHRHDQSVLSLLCKKHGVKPFRDPSQYGEGNKQYSEEICARSQYPQIVFSHRNGDIGSMFQLKYGNRKWYRYITWKHYRLIASKYYRGLFGRCKEILKDH